MALIWNSRKKDDGSDWECKAVKAVSGAVYSNKQYLDGNSSNTLSFLSCLSFASLVVVVVIHVLPEVL